jgi:hypothetical protein
MNFQQSLKIAGRAARANLRPGMLLWSLLLLFLLVYLGSAGFRGLLQQVADFKSRVGYPFSFMVYALFGALLPELLRIVFFQRCRCTVENLRNFLFGFLIWGLCGILGDFFYRCQALWFGPGNDWRTLMTKVAVDQLVYSPLVNSTAFSIFTWRAAKFGCSVWREILSVKFFLQKIFPLLVACWCIWIPGVTLVYFMPVPLQLPVASLILCFYVLVFTFLHKQEA